MCACGLSNFDYSFRHLHSFIQFEQRQRESDIGMSSLTDQQLRSELLSFGEEVPPITNRNRADLIARLERLREKGKRPTRSSPSRARTSTAPTASRSRVVPGLIELSDSDTDAPSNYSSNNTRSSQRSIPVPQSSSIATEVEQSSNDVSVHRSIHWDDVSSF